MPATSQNLEFSTGLKSVARCLLTVPAIGVFAVVFASVSGAWGYEPNRPVPDTPAQVIEESPSNKHVRQGRLENGLRYYLVQTENRGTKVAVQFYVLAGWGRESATENGLSHLLEHTAVESNERFPGAIFYRYLASKGLSSAHFQASVGDTYTTYSLDLPRPDALDPTDSVNMIEQWASKVILTPEIFDAQRRVVAAEASGGAETPAGRYARSADILLGFREGFLMRPFTANESLSRASISDARRFYAKWYVPQQQVVVVVGPVDLDGYEKAIKAQLGKLEPESELASVAPPSQYPLRESRIVIQDEKGDQINASVIYLKERRSKSVTDSLLTEAHDAILQSLLSKLARREMMTLATKMPAAAPTMALGISRPAMNQPNKYDGLSIDFTTRVSGRFEQVLTAGRQLLLSSLDGFGSAELEELKKDIRTSSSFANRAAPSEIGSDIWEEILRSGDIDLATFLHDRNEALDRVTLASFRSYWAGWGFEKPPNALVILDRARFPEITEKSVAAVLAKTPRKVQRAATRSPAWPTPSRMAPSPHFQESISSSGQKICRGLIGGHDILIAPRLSASSPTVRVTSYSRSGTQALPADVRDASHLSAGYFRMFGTTDYTAADLNALSEMGNFKAQFEVHSNSARFELSGPAASLDDMFRYLAAVGSSKTAPSDPSIEKELVDALEEGAPPEEGIFEEVRREFPAQFSFVAAQPNASTSIKARDIVAGLDELIGNLSSYGFVVTGPVDCDSVGKIISGYFAAPNSAATVSEVPATAEIGMPKTLTKDSGQGGYADVTIVLPFTIKDSASEIVAADILKQAIYLRVRGVLREEQSKVYAVIVNSESEPSQGDELKRKIIVKYSVAPDLLDDTLALAKKEIAYVRTALPLDDARLAAKQVEEEYRRTFESPMGFHRQIVGAVIYGKPILDISDQVSTIHAIAPQMPSYAANLLRDDQVHVFIEK